MVEVTNLKTSKNKLSVQIASEVNSAISVSQWKLRRDRGQVSHEIQYKSDTIMEVPCQIKKWSETQDVGIVWIVWP
jgi:hypothetical protein